jgi:hypothetical protein
MLLLAASGAFAAEAQASEAPVSEASAPRQAPIPEKPDGVVVYVPLLEVPDLLAAPTVGWPSMDDANDVVAAADRLLIFGVQRAAFAIFPKNVGLRTGLGMATSGLAAVGTVFIGSWGHEEAHRAVLRNRGITSRNGVYHPDAWSNGTISVDHVSDDALATLKAEHPADTVRLMSAGIESQILVVRQIGDNTFWTDEQGRRLGPLYLGDTWMLAPLLAETASTVQYFGICMDQGSDTLTDEENQLRLEEPARDFTGLDCTAWVYDMRRPDEPYDARGAHPYGEGVDRYRSWEDLTGDEQEWLASQFWLNLINLLNPHLYGIDGVALGEDGRWIAQAGYLPAPWGYRVDLRGAVRVPGLHLGVELQGGVAENGLFPGLDVEIRDIAIGSRVHVDAGLGGWLQPKDLRWDATTRSPGGRAWVTGRVAVVPALAVVVGVEGKTEGFVAGNVHLDPAVTANLGLRLAIP